MRESHATPSVRRLHVTQRLATLLLSVTLLGIVSAAAPLTASASGSCRGYGGYMTPPNYLYVLRQSGPHSGHRQRVNMVKWTKYVLGTQMPGYYPTEALRANAVFVKQYGWYYAMEGHWRGGRDVDGLCYDVKDAGDGWYIPEERSYTTSQSNAVDATWDWSVRKLRQGHYKFILTGYRAGATVPCGTDSDGWHLMQHSAYDCAKDGLNFKQIILRYVSEGKMVYRWQ